MTTVMSFLGGVMIGSISYTGFMYWTNGKMVKSFLLGTLFGGIALLFVQSPMIWGH
jgi:hypothetical protein